MLAMPRLPAVIATVWPGSTRLFRFSIRKLPLDFGRDIADVRRGELLSNAHHSRIWHSFVSAGWE